MINMVHQMCVTTSKHKYVNKCLDVWMTSRVALYVLFLELPRRVQILGKSATSRHLLTRRLAFGSDWSFRSIFPLLKAFRTSQMFCNFDNRFIHLFSYFKIFWTTSFLFLVSVLPMFWHSGYVCSGFQSQAGSLTCMLHHLRAMESSD